MASDHDATVGYRAALVDAGSNATVSGTSNSTDTALATVDLYTMGLVILLFLTVALFGAFTNLALLVSIKCKRSIRNLHYALPFSLCSTNIAMCILWMLVHTVQMVQNYDGKRAYPTICHLNVIFFHICLGTVIFSTVFLAVQRMCKLWQGSSARVPHLVIAGFCVSWIAGVVAGLAMVLQYSNTIDYDICVHGAYTSSSSAAHSTVSMALSVIYILALLGTLVAMAVLTAKRRHHLAVLVLKRDKESPFENNHEGKRVALPDAAGIPTTSSREPSGAESNVSQTFIPVQESFRPGRVPLQPQDAEEEDDDTFDMKMRDRWQKSSGSGRRHTVANIGTRDTMFGPRRGSLEEPKPPSNYQYVRKWSVDITALQNQLENPKLNTTASPFPGLDILKEKENRKAAAAKTTEILEEPEEVADETAPDIPNATSTMEKESKHDEEEIEDINDSTEPLQSSEPQTLCHYNNQHGNRASCQATNEDKVKRLEKELARCTRYLLLLTVTLFSVFPYAVLQLLQRSMAVQTNRNLSYVTAALCTVQCPFHPIILAWLDARIASALSRLHVKLTHWRCVCYCNIGQGKRCLGRHRKHNIADDAADP